MIQMEWRRVGVPRAAFTRHEAYFYTQTIKLLAAIVSNA
jgi:hypothetical protein